MPANAGQVSLYLNYARKHWVNPDGKHVYMALIFVNLLSSIDPDALHTVISNAGKGAIAARHW